MNTNYLDIVETPNPGMKTRKWLVRNITTQAYLGMIHWRTGFRKYVFTPELYPLDFDADCLKKIYEHLEYYTRLHYAELDNKHV